MVVIAVCVAIPVLLILCLILIAAVKLCKKKTPEKVVAEVELEAPATIGVSSPFNSLHDLTVEDENKLNEGNYETDDSHSNEEN